MIKWKNIKEVGNPVNSNLTYLVTDGKEIATTGIYVSTRFKSGCDPIKTFRGWSGDPNTQEYNSCCQGDREFELDPTHWCPTNEINLP